MLKLHWPGRAYRGYFPEPCTGLPGVRKQPEMVTIGFLTFLPPATQGKHLPRSILQGTIAPGQAFTGVGV